MKRVNIHEAKTDLSLPKEVVHELRIGAAEGEFEVPDSFFGPLPDEILKGFSG
jgi:hypothetical protein